MHVVYLDKCLLHISVCRADRLLFCLWGDCYPFRQYSCHVPVVLSDAFPFYLLFCVGCEQGVHMSWYTGASNTFHALSGQVCKCCPLPTEPATSWCSAKECNRVVMVANVFSLSPGRQGVQPSQGYNVWLSLNNKNGNVVPGHGDSHLWSQHLGGQGWPASRTRQ